MALVNNDPFKDNVRFASFFDGVNPTNLADAAHGTVNWQTPSRAEGGVGTDGACMITDNSGTRHPQMTLASPIGTSSFCFEAWVQPAAMENNYGTFLASALNLSSGITFFVGGAGGFVRTALGDDRSYSAAMNDGYWHHIALVGVSGAKLQVYVDGTLVLDEVKSYNLTNTLFEMGCSVESSSAYRYVGSFDNMRLTVGVTRYTENFTPDPMMDWAEETAATSDTMTVTGTAQINDEFRPIDLFAVAYRQDANGDYPTVAHTVASETDGSYTLQWTSAQFDYKEDVIVVAVQPWGEAWAATKLLQVGDRIHPTVPNGYVYDVTTAGTTGPDEPTWADSGSVTDGSVVYAVKPYYRPMCHGPILPTIEASVSYGFVTPLAHYTFDDQLITDEQGNFTLTIYNSPSQGTGQFGGAIQFNGANSTTATYAKSDALNGYQGDFSVCGWAQLADRADTYDIILWHRSGDSTNGNVIRLFGYTLNTLNLNIKDVTVSIGRPTGAFHWVVRYESATGNFDLLINGEVAGSGTTASDLALEACPTYIGRQGPSEVPSLITAMSGWIDELYFFDSCISEEVIGNLIASNEPKYIAPTI